MAVPRRTLSQKGTMQSCKGKGLGVIILVAVAVFFWTGTNTAGDLPSPLSSSSFITATATAAGAGEEDAAAASAADGGGVVAAKSASSSSNNKKPSSLSTFPPGYSVQASPLERKIIGGVDVLMQTPLMTPPKGLLFVGHGCSHAHTDFWPSTPEICPDCVGLPEELAIVKMALEDFGFAVVAISSESRCWKVGDIRRVSPALKEIAASLVDNNNDKIPILAFGASSGGNFVGSALLDSMEDHGHPLTGYISQISAPDPRVHPGSSQHPLPIAVYIIMNRDKDIKAKVKKIVASLQDEKHPAKRIQLKPLPITDTFFHDRIHGISIEQSKAMADALLNAGYLDSETRLLLQDPRRSGWRPVIKDHIPSWDGLVADESPISEVMNVAWARHEMSRDGVRDAIEFILKEHAERGPIIR